jgi:hypothetical protein
MSDNIYDIIGKLNGLGSKSNPVSTSAESVYENVDPKDITASVNSMMDKYENFLIEEKSKKFTFEIKKSKEKVVNQQIIEQTNCYFPMRGNGWYSQAVIEYCLSVVNSLNNLILNMLLIQA